MSNVIQSAIFNYLPAGRKSTATGWVKFNAPCCTHLGETPDKRYRGNAIAEPDGSFNYHCFNCNFKTGYKPGWNLSAKLRKLMGWVGMPDNEIQRLALEAIRMKSIVDLLPVEQKRQFDFNFPPRDLPPNSLTFNQWAEFFAEHPDDVSEDFMKAVEYIQDRCIDLSKYDFYWSPDQGYNMNHRVIIPIYWRDKIVGSTARSFDSNSKRKYHSSYAGGLLFNLQNQKPDSKFVVVVEGPFDAMAIDGVAVMSNELSDEQIELINRLDREVIVIPDFDVKPNKQGRLVWAGEHLVDQAEENGWSVAFPTWSETCKDVNQAVKEYGALFTLKNALDNRVNDYVKIELKKRRVYSR